MMKTFVLLCLFIPGSAFAKSPAVVDTSKRACVRCAEIRKLETTFLNLKYEVEAQRLKGRSQMTKVLAELQRFFTNQRRAPIEEFRAIVGLVAAALPFDAETESAESLANLLQDNDAFKSAYELAVKDVSDHCRKNLLTTMVKERLCMLEAEDKGQLEANPTMCVAKPVFRYDQCVGVNLED